MREADAKSWRVVAVSTKTTTQLPQVSGYARESPCIYIHTDGPAEHRPSSQTRVTCCSIYDISANVGQTHLPLNHEEYADIRIRDARYANRRGQNWLQLVDGLKSCVASERRCISHDSDAGE